MLGTGPLFFWVGLSLLAVLAGLLLLPASLTRSEPSTVIDFVRNGVRTPPADFESWRTGETERIASIDADVVAERWRTQGAVGGKDRRARDRAASMVVSHLIRN